MSMLWIVVFTNIALGLASGEVSIRYFAWYLAIRRLNERIAAAPVILGVSFISAGFCAIMLQWFLLRSTPFNAKTPGMTDNSVFLEVTRLFLFAGFCFTTYPVTKVHYNSSWEIALTEMVVRIFLVITSLIFGFGCATIYHCQLMNAC